MVFKALEEKKSEEYVAIKLMKPHSKSNIEFKLASELKNEFILTPIKLYKNIYRIKLAND